MATTHTCVVISCFHIPCILIAKCVYYLRENVLCLKCYENSDGIDGDAKAHLQITSPRCCGHQIMLQTLQKKSVKNGTYHFYNVHFVSICMPPLINLTIYLQFSLNGVLANCSCTVVTFSLPADQLPG